MKKGFSGGQAHVYVDRLESGMSKKQMAPFALARAGSALTDHSVWDKVRL